MSTSDEIAVVVAVVGLIGTTGGLITFVADLTKRVKALEDAERKRDDERPRT